MESTKDGLYKSLLDGVAAVLFDLFVEQGLEQDELLDACLGAEPQVWGKRDSWQAFVEEFLNLADMDYFLEQKAVEEARKEIAY